MTNPKLLLILGTALALIPSYTRAESSVPPRVITIDFRQPLR